MVLVDSDKFGTMQNRRSLPEMTSKWHKSVCHRFRTIRMPACIEHIHISALIEGHTKPVHCYAPRVSSALLCLAVTSHCPAVTSHCPNTSTTLTIMLCASPSSGWQHTANANGQGTKSAANASVRWIQHIWCAILCIIPPCNC